MLAITDLVIIGTYAVGLFVVAQWVSRSHDGHATNAGDFFLAGRSLPWWAIGASLIASNISAEQIIGMSGSGYAIGLAIASYEWLAAITLLVVGKYFLPVFLANGIHTMPEFLEQRYDRRVRVLMAFFWVLVYVFVNLTSVLWLGALAINTVSGLNIELSLAALAFFALAYSSYGGLRAIALTDTIQVFLLVVGGLFTLSIMLDLLADGGGAVEGLRVLLASAPEKFDLILDREHPHYASLPGLSVLLGGMWVMHFSYWGFNQYIIQRALGARSLADAQRGIAFAAFLKVLMPLIVVLPGIAVYTMGMPLSSADEAYPTAINLLPVGLKGLVIAALLAAIVSSLASMANSISTLVTLDLLPVIRNDLSTTSQLRTGRLAGCLAMLVAALSARPLLGSFDQAFQYIQEFTGFFTPGIVVIFLLGVFWHRASAAGALAAALVSVSLSLALKILWPELPFIDRVGLVFLVALAIALSLGKRTDTADTPRVAEVSFATGADYKVASVMITSVIALIYATWW
ncbi:MAG: sodium/solute symporter [Congregibacter sp.]